MNEEERAWLRRRIAESAKAPVPEPSGVPRRAVLFGALVAGAAVGAGAMARSGERSGSGVRERAERLAGSPDFAAAVAEAAREYGTRHEVRVEGAERSELDIIIDRSERDRISGKSCSSYFRDEVMAGMSDDEIPASLRAELSHLVPGLIAYESTYDNDAVAYAPKRTVLPSRAAAEKLAHRLNTPVIVEEYPDGRVLIEERALARMQALPSTFVEYGFEMKDIQDPASQARFIGKYFKEAYRIFRQTDAFNAVRQKYFPNDHDGFRKHFVVPVMLNAYHSGIGTMQDLVVWFAARRVRPELSGRGYDAYYLMNRLALERRSDLPGDARNFGPEAAKYVPHSYALASGLDEADGRRNAFLPG